MIIDRVENKGISLSDHFAQSLGLRSLGIIIAIPLPAAVGRSGAIPALSSAIT